MTYNHVAGGNTILAQTINDLIDYGPNLPAVAESKDTAVTNGTTASVTFVNTLTTGLIRGVAIVAPPSGKIQVMGTSGGSNSLAGGFTLTSFEVRQGASIGTGTVVQASDENTASQFQSGTNTQPGQHSVIGIATGLTPGQPYNVCLTYRVTANTGTWNRRRIWAGPVEV
jgi:hypothetical protein